MADPNPPPVAPPIVDKALVKSGLADGSILLLDVRNLAQGEGKIPGSKNLPCECLVRVEFFPSAVKNCFGSVIIFFKEAVFIVNLSWTKMPIHCKVGV